jgi:DNA-nicking Smr family endonuclease
MEIDLHGYYPSDVNLTAIVQQVWEMGCQELWIIHGHGRNRGCSPGFVNTNTGGF